MYSSTHTFTDPIKGKCEVRALLSDDNEAQLSIITNIGSETENSSVLTIPKGLLSTTYYAIQKLENISRNRHGLTKRKDDDDEDFDDGDYNGALG